MISQQTLNGNWSEIKGKLRSRWVFLTDADLEASKENIEQLVDSIQRKTGEVREAIKQYIDEVSLAAAAASRTAGRSASTPIL
jgi:uncharacterized protein YjbJ (UPF0337 family)